MIYALNIILYTLRFKSVKKIHKPCFTYLIHDRIDLGNTRKRGNIYFNESKLKKVRTEKKKSNMPRTYKRKRERIQ